MWLALFYGVPFVLLMVWWFRRQGKRESKHVSVLDEATAAGLTEPASLHPVFRGDARHFIGSGKEMTPILHVFLGIAEIFSLSGRPAAGMNPDDFFKRYGAKRKRITVAKIVGSGKGKLIKIFQGLNALRSDSRPVQLGAVLRRTAIGMGHGPLEPL